MSLKPIRDEIDEIDRQLIELYTRRMECSKKVARYKMENGIPILNTEREQQVTELAAERAGEYGPSAKLLYSTIMELSRALQHDMLGSGAALRNELLTAKKNVPYDDSSVRIACFGAEGAYAHKAAKKLFREHLRCSVPPSARYSRPYSADRLISALSRLKTAPQAL